MTKRSEGERGINATDRCYVFLRGARAAGALVAWSVGMGAGVRRPVCMEVEMTDATRQRLTAFARECIVNSGGDPDAMSPAHETAILLREDGRRDRGDVTDGDVGRDEERMTRR